MNKKLIIANWKANPDAPGRAAVLASKIEQAIATARNIEVVIAPPFPFLTAVASIIRHAKLGSQNAFWGDTGPFTGEVSWHQLKHLKVRYVIVGHSERRLLLGETDEMVNRKIRALLEHGIAPVLCVGEREHTDTDISPVVSQQVRAALIGVKKELLKNLVVAYEPVWAISTTSLIARVDTSERMFRARLTIEKAIADMYDHAAAKKVRIIYGGSVRQENIAAIIGEGHMDGALVGEASLDAQEFGAIVRSAAEVAN